MRRRLIAVAAAVVVTHLGCFREIEAPDLGGLYNREAMDHGPHRNPVVVIPGLLGSRLIDGETGRVVWGAFEGDHVDPAVPEDARLAALPMREEAALRELTDTVVPDGALDRFRVRLLGLPIEQAAYLHILGSLGVGGYRDQLLGEAGAVDYGPGHYTCYQFDYDWRRDIRESARRLDAFIRRKREEVQREIALRYGLRDHEVRFDIVAHSLGGLVTRHWLRYGAAEESEITWAGAEMVDRVIIVGTPNAGAALALDNLVNGKRFAPTLPVFEAGLLGSMPSIYQLLPRSRHGVYRDADTGEPLDLDILDPTLWERMGWGLADPDQDEFLQMILPEVADASSRRRVALDHQRKCLQAARLLQEALDRPAELPEGLEMYLITGDGEETPALVAVDQRSGDVEIAEWGPGDGTVLRSSALMDERIGGSWEPTLSSPIDWTGVTFLFEDHLGLTQHPLFTDNVLFLLLQKPR